jgi:hypothetical protein
MEELAQSSPPSPRHATPEAVRPPSAARPPVPPGPHAGAGAGAAGVAAGREKRARAGVNSRLADYAVDITHEPAAWVDEWTPKRGRWGGRWGRGGGRTGGGGGHGGGQRPEAHAENKDRDRWAAGGGRRVVGGGGPLSSCDRRGGRLPAGAPPPPPRSLFRVAPMPLRRPPPSPPRRWEACPSCGFWVNLGRASSVPCALCGAKVAATEQDDFESWAQCDECGKW